MKKAPPRSRLDWRLFRLSMCLADSPDVLPRHVVVQLDALDPAHDRLLVADRGRPRRARPLERRLRAFRSRPASLSLFGLRIPGSFSGGSGRNISNHRQEDLGMTLIRESLVRLVVSRGARLVGRFFPRRLRRRLVHLALLERRRLALQRLQSLQFRAFSGNPSGLPFSIPTDILDREARLNHLRERDRARSRRSRGRASFSPSIRPRLARRHVRTRVRGRETIH